MAPKAEEDGNPEAHADRLIEEQEAATREVRRRPL